MTPVNENYDEQYEQMPPHGHRKRFLNKLDKQLHDSQHSIIRFQALTIAASIAIVVSLAAIMLVRVYNFNSEKLLLSRVSPEMSETELYYQQSINNRLETLKNQDNFNNDMLSDINDIDKTLENLSCDVEQNPGDKRVVETILMVYQTKLELVNELIYRTK